MAVQQKQILANLDTLCSCTINFPGILAEAVASSLINSAEKAVITSKYQCIEEKLTTFFLIISGKGSTAIETLHTILEATGNIKAATVFKNVDGVNTSNTETMNNFHQSTILNNLDRLCSHTMNLPIVFCYASGLGLISGKEREVIMDRFHSTDEQFAEFYKLTTTKGPDAFEKLVQVLTMTQNQWALEVLRCQEENESSEVIEN